MSVIFSRNGVSMPDLVRTKLANHLARLGRAADVHTLALAQERAEGFVEGVEAARALTPATIEGLFIAVEDAAGGNWRHSGTLSALVSQPAIRETGGGWAAWRG